jgi:amino acid transporter
MEDIAGIPQPITTWAIMGIVLAFNLFGVGLYGKAEAIMTIGMVLIFLVVGLLGLFRVGEAAGVATPLAVQPAFFETGTAWLSGVGVAIWWFIGFEFACPIAEENVKPHVNIPRALWVGLVSILILDVILVEGMVRYLPLDELAGSAIPQIDGARAMLGEWGATFMTIITILAALTTANAEMAALPRMLYGMSREGLVPRMFAWIHPRFRTPWVGTFFTVAIMGITIVYISAKGADINSILTLIMTACIAWMISYAIAMVDVIVLRRKHPDYPRLWKAPGGSVAMIIGIAGVAYAIYTLPDYWAYSGIYMAVILAYCVIWLKFKKLPLLQTTPIEYLAKEIMDRSEPIQEWGPAVDDWLSHRDWDHAGYVEFEHHR